MAIDQSKLFNYVPDEQIRLNEFVLSHDVTMSTNAGFLVPVLISRIIAGERWTCLASVFSRLASLLSPVFGKMDVYLHAFYCPDRVLSDQWENYIRAGEDGQTDFEPDLINFRNANEDYDIRTPITPEEIFSWIGSYGNSSESYRDLFCHGSLGDYLGIGSCMNKAQNAAAEAGLSAEESNFDIHMRPFRYSLMPFKMYQAVWSEYYADANIHEFENMDTIDFRWMCPINQLNLNFGDASLSHVSISRTSGKVISNEYDNFDVYYNLMQMRYRCYAKDYFTSALPEPQRGPDVLIPMQAEIEIQNNLLSSNPTRFAAAGPSSTEGFLGFSDNNSFNERVLLYGDATQQDTTQTSVEFRDLGQVRIYNADQLRAEISQLASTVTDLRTAVALQEFYESSNRYGNRYREFIYGHTGSLIPDEQLTRPWYLGGMKLPIQISEVTQTGPNSSGDGVGDLYGKGLAATIDNGFLFERTFSDYGQVMIILSIRPHSYYRNLVPKEYTIVDRMDEYWRKLQAVGEEPILNWELQGNFYPSATAVEYSSDVFGYQMRYSNYKYRSDRIHGDFKDTLSYMTIYRDTNEATLSPEFIEVHPEDIANIFQYTKMDQDHFWFNIHFDLFRDTPMDIYSIPRIN